MISASGVVAAGIVLAEAIVSRRWVLVMIVAVAIASDLTKALRAKAAAGAAK